VKATKKSEEFSFYSLPEFEEWKASKDNWHTYKIKYYKGNVICVYTMIIVIYLFFYWICVTEDICRHSLLIKKRMA
jgi:hypothetical protein